jgi:uncharacterized membrane protein YhiD involved in acid resistance
MPWLIARVIALGVPAKLAKPILAVIAALLLIGALWGLKSLHDRRVISQHEAKQEASTAKADKRADNHAADQRRTDDARSTQEAQQIKEAVNEAGSDPAARRAAYYRCVSAQQSARRAGKPSPDC